MDLIAQSVFGEVAALLALAAIVGFLGLMLRQPLIVSFIAVGLLAGPSALDIVRSGDQIGLLSQLGIAVLLFLVGIKLDVKLIRSLGLVSLLTGLGQVAVTAAFGFLIGLALNFSPVESLYIAVALTFSSTIIIVKMLSDKREIDSLHGQVALGCLIVQDLVVVLAMIVLSAIGIGAGENAHSRDIFVVLGAGALFLVAVVLFVKYLANPLTEQLARAPELLITFAIAQAALFAAIADMIGLGKELGGLLAGVSLASTPYREAVAARLAPLRDFLLLFFFVGLGAELELQHMGTYGMAAVILSVFVLLAKPLIMLATTGAMGFRKRTGFLAGVTLAQISEFSLIFLAMGVALGHVSGDIFGMVTLVGLITIAASTYMITYSHRLYALAAPLLGVFERKNTSRESGDGGLGERARYDYIMLGMGRFGAAIALRLQRQGHRVLGVDFSPPVVRFWRGRGLDVEYGDSTDPEFLGGLPLDGVKWVVSTMPIHVTGITHNDIREAIVHVLRSAGFAGQVAVTAHHTPDTGALLAAGVDLILEPFQDAADRAVELLLGQCEQDRSPSADPTGQKDVVSEPLAG